ncbi:MAG TPA: SDR family NAD(P)-dependent oxidoreductase [Pseudonocardiaceae bacterium]|nr:SDR family NAD(P)-dependent oxidoreductase [Pseudonocardiaceae bacterium]
MRLAGARVLVTGASSGIGAAAAVELAGRGAKPLLAGRNSTALASLAARIDGDWHAADLAEPGAARELAGWAASAGGVDVLVCNAGVGWAGPLVEMADDKIGELVAVNVAAPLRLTRELLPSMVHNGYGRLVFVSSIAGCLGVAEEAVYSATKGALRVFADSMRLELAGSGVGVSSVFPGVVDTAFFGRRGRPYDRQRPRPVAAETVAAAIGRAIERDRSEVFVPGWLRFPARLHGALPALVQTLERRFG